MLLRQATRRGAPAVSEMQQPSEEEDRGSEPVRRLNTSSSSVLVRAAAVMMSSDECVARLGSLPPLDRLLPFPLADAAAANTTY